MSYLDVGTYVDLSHINRRASSRVQKKSGFQQATDNLFEVGTKISFKEGRSARVIPVLVI